MYMLLHMHVLAIFLIFYFQTQYNIHFWNGVFQDLTLHQVKRDI